MPRPRLKIVTARPSFGRYDTTPPLDTFTGGPASTLRLTPKGERDLTPRFVAAGIDIPKPLTKKSLYEAYTKLIREERAQKLRAADFHLLSNSLSPENIKFLLTHLPASDRAALPARVRVAPSFKLVSSASSF